MNTAQARALPLLLAPAGAGAAIPFLTAGGHAAPVIAALALALVATFVVWPWAVLPASIVGGAAAAAATSLASVTAVVGIHGGVIGAGLIALSIRRLVDPLPRRRPTGADIPMALLAAIVALGCLFGITAGNKPHATLVAAYELSVIPAYYWLATRTLVDRADRRRAMLLFLVGAVALAAVGLATPGRHGGLLSALALVPTLIAASRAPRLGARWTLLGCAALLGVDVALAAYRSIWLATGIALLVVAVRGTRSARRTVLTAVMLTGTFAVASLAVSPAGPSRLAVVQSELHASAGYRLPEAAVGLRSFTAAPLLGAGLGQVTSAVFIPGFRVGDVGPVYHVFYITVLANGGVLLALALVAALLPALRVLTRRRPGDALPWAALLAGFLVAAAFAGPTDGHWELGLLPALALLETAAERPRRRSSRASQKGEATAAAAATREPIATVSPPDNEKPGPASATRPRPDAPSPSVSAAPRPGIHAVVVTYESRSEIVACLESLIASVERVVVVDNDSDDGTAAIVAERFPSVEVIANQSNVGFACAVNRGIERLEHDTVMLVNPDCVIEPGASRLLREHLLANSDVGIVAPRILGSDGVPVVSVHPFETLGTVLASRFGGSVVPMDLRHLVSWGQRRRAMRACELGERPMDVDWASGACLAVRGDLMERIGGLDEAYFMYYEDEELCLSAARSGARVVYLPAARVRHAGGASSGDPAAAWPFLYASMLLFFARHRPASVPALRVALIVRAAIGAVLATVRGKRRRALAWWRVAKVVVRRPVLADGRQADTGHIGT